MYSYLLFDADKTTAIIIVGINAKKPTADKYVEIDPKIFDIEVSLYIDEWYWSVTNRLVIVDIDLITILANISITSNTGINQ